MWQGPLGRAGLGNKDTVCLSQALHTRHTLAPAVFAVLQVPQHPRACGFHPLQNRGMEWAASGSLLQKLYQDREQLPCQDSWLCKNVGFILLVQAGSSGRESRGVSEAEGWPRGTPHSLMPVHRSSNSPVGLQLLHNTPEIQDGDVLK